jgi:hypothetical protein
LEAGNFCAVHYPFDKGVKSVLMPVKHSYVDGIDREKTISEVVKV